MVKGDIIKYNHGNGKVFYGIVSDNDHPAAYHVLAYLLLDPEKERWRNVPFDCNKTKVELVEAV